MDVCYPSPPPVCGRCFLLSQSTTFFPVYGGFDSWDSPEVGGTFQGLR